MSMIVALYDDLSTVEKVAREIQTMGFGKEHMHLATHDGRAQERGSGGFFDSLSTLFGRTPHDLGNQPKSLVDQMTGWGIDKNDAGQYAEAVRRGNTMLMVNAGDDRLTQVRQIMEQHNPIDIDQRVSDWQQSGWQGYDANAKPYSEDEIRSERTRLATTNNQKTTNLEQGGEKRIPIVEEELRVGKREVQKGGVRVHTTVTEKPVEETHTLRDETVNVERRPADRTMRAGELDNAFREQTFEVTETGEELIADKQARVTGEVVISKQAEERSETVRDTLRRTEVHTEDLGAGQTSRTRNDFSAYDSDFRNHFGMLRSSGHDYNYYEPGYRYGYDLAGNDRYRGQKWSDLEMNARRDWESRNPNSKWDDFKDSIRFAWERATRGGEQNTGTTGTTGFSGNEGYDANRSEGRFNDPNLR